MTFSDGSSIRYEGKDEVHVDCTDGEQMICENVLYIPKLKTNSLSFRKLDSQGCDIHLKGGLLTLRDRQGTLLMKIPKMRENMYLLKLNVIEHCLLIIESKKQAWLWYRRMCHQSAHTLHNMVRGNYAIGLPHFSKFEHKCNFCMTRKHARAPFPKSTKFKASKPLESVYANSCEQITPLTINGGKYFFANY